MNNGKLLLVTEILRSNRKEGGFYLQHLPGELLRMLEALAEPRWNFSDIRCLLDEAKYLDVLEPTDLPPRHYHELRRRAADVPVWYREALEAVQALEVHISALQQETHAAIEKSFRLERENAALRTQLARKDRRLQEFETGVALPTACAEEAGKKWLITFADISAECRDSIQIRTLALLLGSTPETACSTRWLYEAARGESSASPVDEPEGGDFNAETADEECYASRIGDITVEGLRITDRRAALRSSREEDLLYGVDTGTDDEADSEDLRLYNNVKTNLLNVRRLFHDRLPSLYGHLDSAFAWSPRTYSVSYSPRSPVVWSIRWQPR